MDIDFIKTYQQNEVQYISEADEFPTQAILMTFEEKEYDFEGLNVIITQPFRIIAKKLYINCNSLVLKGSGYVENTEIKGNLISHYNIELSNCQIHTSKRDVSGIVHITNGHTRMTNCEVYEGNVPGIFIEESSGAYLEKCFIHDVQHTLVAASNTSILSVVNCKLENSPHNGIHSYKTRLTVSNTTINRSQYPAISIFERECRIENATILNVEQNAISIDNSPNAVVTNCKINAVQATAISISRGTKGTFTSNKFDHIGGNCFHISESSTAIINDNVADSCSYPVFAILMNCEATIHDNQVSNCDLSGGCFRNAKSVRFFQNSFSNIKDCGLSISDTEYAQVQKNIFKNCRVAGVEAYNNSEVVIEDNEMSDLGQCCFYSYAGATITASNNTISNVGESFAKITSHGNGYFENNKIKNCPKLMQGPTTGTYFFENNGSFENITNNPAKVKKNIKLEEKYINQNTNVCFNCTQRLRDTYLFPCGHKIYCRSCAEDALNQHKSCPLCRFPIEKISTGYVIEDDKDFTCLICGANPIDAIVLPCGHIGFCTQCLHKWLTEHTDCPFCRTTPVSYKKIVQLD